MVKFVTIELDETVEIGAYKVSLVALLKEAFSAAAIRVTSDTEETGANNTNDMDIGDTWYSWDESMQPIFTLAEVTTVQNGEGTFVPGVKLLVYSS